MAGRGSTAYDHAMVRERVFIGRISILNLYVMYMKRARLHGSQFAADDVRCLIELENKSVVDAKYVWRRQAFARMECIFGIEWRMSSEMRSRHRRLW